MPAAPSRSPARPSPDREAKSAHIEARSELLSLIASHAAEELGDELGAAAMVDVALPPPKLALAEAAARKKAAADAEEERARRQAAVEKLADRVAKHNDTRARRAPRSGDDAEVESTSAAFRPPSAATPDSGWAAMPSGAGPDDRGGGPGETAEARAARKAAREANKPWRAGMRRPGSASGLTSAPDSDARDAAARREESERRKAEVRAYIRESKARWKAKLAKEKADLRAAEQRRQEVLKTEREASREAARAAAAKRGIAGFAKPPTKLPEWDATLSPERRENDAIETRGGETTGVDGASEGGASEGGASEGGATLTARRAIPPSPPRAPSPIAPRRNFARRSAAPAPDLAPAPAPAPPSRNRST